MLPYDTLLTFGAGMLFCGWMLWDLRKENKKAEARKQAALAAAASFGPPAPLLRVAAPPRPPSVSPAVVRPPRPSGGAPHLPTLPSSLHLSLIHI